jgi:predicted permease
MGNDIRFAFRTLRRAPGFTLIAVLSLALGIGANTAIFSLMYQVTVRSLAVQDPESLVSLQSDDYYFGWTRRDSNQTVFSYPMYTALRDRNQSFSALIARAAFQATLAYRGNAAGAGVELVSGNLFQALGVQAAAGRLLLPDDDAPGRPPVVMLSYAYFTSRLGANPDVIGGKILLNGQPAQVVGVAPESFRGLLAGSTPECFAPLSMVRMALPGFVRDTQPDSYWLSVFGRLKPGISDQRANAMLLPLFRGILQDELPRFTGADRDARTHILAKPIHVEPAAQGINQLRDTWQKPLLVLIAMTGLVLLIACANVANLLMARSAARQREIALRLAIGATRWQLFRQLLVETVVLSLAGGIAGLAAAQAMSQGLVSLLPADATGGWISTQLDLRLFAYSMAVALITGALFGLAPALQGSRRDPVTALKQQTSGMSAGGGQSRVRQILVSAQICLSLLLLIGAGLFTRSLLNLLRNDVGFQPDRLVAFQINPGLSGYAPAASVALFRDLQQRLAAIPGVQAAAHAEFAPFSDMHWGNGIKAPGTRNASDKYAPGSENSVSANYFRTMGIPLLAGREFTGNDTAQSPKVLILSANFAKFLYEDQSPIGRHVRMGENDADLEIVGVVQDSKYSDVREKPPRFLYIPYEQGGADFLTQSAFFVRARGPEAGIVNGIRGVVKQMDANIPVEKLRAMKEAIGNSMQTERMIATLAIAFGLLAAVLAAVGLYGTLSYAVTRRTREFGIRIALGADRRRVLFLVLREVAWLLTAGIGIGAPASFLLARLIESQLYGIDARDPWMIAGAAALMGAVALIAALAPAIRAMRVEPLQALRHE